VGRNKVVCAKAVACVCNLLALAVFSGLCNYFTAILPLGGLEQRKAAFTTTLGLFLTGLTLFAITLLASSLTRTYKGAVRIGAGILLLFYGISITAEYLEAPMLYCLTPLKFFDVYTVAISGIQFSFFLLAMIIAIGSVITAQRVWTLREI
jgi:ABC-2 type transport system permease protein